MKKSFFTHYSRYYWFRMVTDASLFLLILLASNIIGNELSLVEELFGSIVLGLAAALSAPNQRLAAPQPNEHIQTIKS
ncbi:hypothetical protein [Loigolactobacillus iwatensis]|uniref:hypothetical protein n=1 Tax=Loigolactobacillus iwatensis TaxID=1267156 RepID=UPI000F7F79AE|nr:hypothetical protein [Loigolactobacillus iwatensis]